MRYLQWLRQVTAIACGDRYEELFSTCFPDFRDLIRLHSRHAGVRCVNFKSTDRSSSIGCQGVLWTLAPVKGCKGVVSIIRLNYCVKSCTARVWLPSRTRDKSVDPCQKRSTIE